MEKLNSQSFVAYVGIDWADTKHDVCIQAAGSELREFDIITHKPEVIDEWALSMHQRFGSPIAIAVELSKGPIVYALQKYDFFVIFPINPLSLARYRETFQTSGAKSDPIDAELAVDLILCHPERFKPLKPQSIEIRALSIMVEQRRNLVNDKIRVTNRLRYDLKQYYPQILDWFEDIDSVLFCDFLKRYPTLKQAKRVQKRVLQAFFKKHSMHFQHVLDRRVIAIKEATPLTLDEAVIIPFRLNALVLVEQLRAILVAIKQYDVEIESLAIKHADYALFSSLPGAGAKLAPRLLVAFGEQRERFKTAADLQQYSGIAPVTESSGKKHWVHWRWRCPTFLRQTFVEWAGMTIRKSFWAEEYYRQQRDKGSNHNAALRSLAFKWIRIIFRCWQTNTLYDEAVYLKALRQRGSPLLRS